MEKYLTTYKSYGNVIDIVKNPSKKELKELADTYRFIADSKTKTIYFADGWVGTHAQMWDNINKQKKDFSRKSVYDGTIMAGELYQDGTVRFDSIDLYDVTEYEIWAKKDWSWTKKWLPKLDKAMKKYKKERGAIDF